MVRRGGGGSGQSTPEDGHDQGRNKGIIEQGGIRGSRKKKRKCYGRMLSRD